MPEWKFGAINNTFRAPTTPGVYYVTQTASWEYNIFDNGSGVPDNDPANAIAVVIVDGVYKPYAMYLRVFRFINWKLPDNNGRMY